MPLTHLLIVGSLAVTVGYLAALALTTVVTALGAGGRREDDLESVDALAGSRLTIPVSIIVGAGDAPDISRSVRDLLGLDYPEFEVIVVVDQPARSVAAIEDEWALESVEFFYRRTLDTGAVKRIFRSGRDPRLMVIEREPGHPSDALNVGVNVARYRFVATVPLGVRFDRDGLLRTMAPALDDPRTVVAVFSPCEADGAWSPESWASRSQQLRAIRATMVSRLFEGGTARQMDGPGVRVWRRDAVLNAGGFSGGAVRPDVDLAFRVLREPDSRVVCSRESFGVLEVSPELSSGQPLRDRYRVALAVLRDVKLSTLSPSGRLRVMAFLEAELLTPLSMTWVVVASLLGAVTGALSWPATVSALVLLAFGAASVSVVAVLLAGSHRRGLDPTRARALLWVAPFELAATRLRLASAITRSRSSN